MNLGSDHPSLIEAMVKGRQERPNEFPKIITCPNEVRQRLPSFDHPVRNLRSESHRWSLSRWRTATPATLRAHNA